MSKKNEKKIQCVSTECDFKTDSLKELAKHGAKKHPEKSSQLKKYLISALE